MLALPVNTLPPTLLHPGGCRRRQTMEGTTEPERWSSSLFHFLFERVRLQKAILQVFICAIRLPTPIPSLQGAPPRWPGWTDRKWLGGNVSASRKGRQRGNSTTPLVGTNERVWQLQAQTLRWEIKLTREAAGTSKAFRRGSVVLMIGRVN